MNFKLHFTRILRYLENLKRLLNRELVFNDTYLIGYDFIWAKVVVGGYFFGPNYPDFTFSLLNMGNDIFSNFNPILEYE